MIGTKYPLWREKIRQGLKCWRHSVKIDREYIECGWMLIKRGMTDFLGTSKYPEGRG